MRLIDWAYIAGGVALLSLGVWTGTALTESRFQSVHAACAKQIPEQKYDKCPVEIDNALTNIDLVRTETVIEYRDRTIKVENKVNKQLADENAALRADLAALQEISDDTPIYSPALRTVRSQLCRRAGDCAPGPPGSENLEQPVQ